MAWPLGTLFQSQYLILSYELISLPTNAASLVTSLNSEL